MKYRAPVAFMLGAVLGLGGPLAAGAAESTIDLTVTAGRPLRVALDRRERVDGLGQQVTATLIEPVYAYDRVVLPVGTQALGHIEKLERVSKRTRLHAIVGGDFTPLRHTILRFDTLVLPDGNEIRMSARVESMVENIAFQVAREPKSRASRAREAAGRRIRESVAPFTAPGKMARLKSTLVSRLPYHPQYLSKGTVYTLELLEPLNFGTAMATEWAPPGTAPPSESVLQARLTTALDSATTARGTIIRAVLTQPLLSADRKLILPEGAELQGEVTFSKHARRLRRNGELRFLFDTVRLADRGPERLLASLYATELSGDAHLAIDEEGGARITNPKTRFIAPVLALFSVQAARSRDVIDAGEVGNATAIDGANVGGRAAAGLFGLGLVGTAVGQLSRSVATTLGVVGLGETLYRNVLGKGREVVFPLHTPVELQLSPASTGQ